MRLLRMCGLAHRRAMTSLAASLGTSPTDTCLHSVTVMSVSTIATTLPTPPSAANSNAPLRKLMVVKQYALTDATTQSQTSLTPLANLVCCSKSRFALAMNA